MNWTTPRQLIKPAILSLNQYLSLSSNKEWNKLKDKVLTNTNICRFCGGSYTKRLICIFIDKNTNNLSSDNLDACCRGCYIISHMNLGFHQQLEIYYSELSQLDIIRKSIDYITEYNRIPSSIEIDNDIESVPLSTIEFINIINYDTNNLLANYKVFYSQEFDYKFLNTYYSFINDNTKPIKQLDIPIHELTCEESTFYNKILI